MSQLDRVTCELRDEFEHERERGRCMYLLGIVSRLSSERETNRSEFDFVQLENEQVQCSLHDELGEARQDISRLLGQMISEI